VKTNYHSDTEDIGNTEYTKSLKNALKEAVNENEMVINILIISSGKK
jgi:hypothetical protein